MSFVSGSTEGRAVMVANDREHLPHATGRRTTASAVQTKPDINAGQGA